MPESSTVMSELHILLSEVISNDHVLSTSFEIENVMILIGELNKKIEFYKELKKYRANTLDNQISSLSAKVESLRQVILNSMKHHSPSEKTLNFPPIGKVSRRSGKASWQIDNEDELLEFLEKIGKKEEIMRVVNPSIDRRKLTLVLDHCNTNDLVGAKKVPGTESLSITFGKTEDGQTYEEKLPVDVNLDSLDTLVV